MTALGSSPLANVDESTLESFLMEKDVDAVK